jgi:hypothetical protein
MAIYLPNNFILSTIVLCFCFKKQNFFQKKQKMFCHLVIFDEGNTDNLDSIFLFPACNTPINLAKDGLFLWRLLLFKLPDVVFIADFVVFVPFLRQVLTPCFTLAMKIIVSKKQILKINVTTPRKLVFQLL